MLQANYNQKEMKNSNKGEEKENNLEDKVKEQSKKNVKKGKIKIEGYCMGDYELLIPAFKKANPFGIIPIEVLDVDAGSIEKHTLYSGATLKCTQGDSSSTYTVLPIKKVYINDKPLAVISDMKPMVNIKPFGMCKSMANPTVAAATAANRGRLQKMPCVPNTVGMWSEGVSHFISDEMTPCNKSKCMCAYAGEISVQDVAQSTVGSSGGSSSKEEKEDEKKEEEKTEEFKEIKEAIFGITKSYKK